MEPVQKNKHIDATGKGAIDKGMGKKNSGGSAHDTPPVPAAKNITAAKNKAKEMERLGQLSSSLKKVYQTTVDEAVPDAMMDLLKQLG